MIPQAALSSDWFLACGTIQTCLMLVKFMLDPISTLVEDSEFTLLECANIGTQISIDVLSARR